MKKEEKLRKSSAKNYKVLERKFTEIPKQFHGALPESIRKKVNSKTEDVRRRDGHFSRMKLVILIDPTLTWFQKVLFSVLESLTYRFEIVNPSYEYLSDILSVDKKTIQRNIKVLINHGLLYVIKRQNFSNLFLVADVDFVYTDFPCGLKTSKLQWVDIQNFMDVLRSYFKDKFSKVSGNKRVLEEDASVLTKSTEKSLDIEGGYVEKKYVETMIKDLGPPMSHDETSADFSVEHYREEFLEGLMTEIQEESIGHIHSSSWKGSPDLTPDVPSRTNYETGRGSYEV